MESKVIKIIKRVQNNAHTHKQFLLNNGHFPIISKKCLTLFRRKRPTAVILSLTSPTHVANIQSI